MAIDFSMYEQTTPQKEETKPVEETGMADVTIRVDADCFMQCDGEFIDIQIQAGVMAKTQLPIGQHLLEFISTQNSNVKVEKVVDFPQPGKSYLVLVNELKAAIAPPMPSSLPIGEGVGRGPQNSFLDQLNQMAQMNPLAGMGGMPPMPNNDNNK